MFANGVTDNVKLKQGQSLILFEKLFAEMRIFVFGNDQSFQKSAQSTDSD